MKKSMLLNDSHSELQYALIGPTVDGQIAGYIFPRIPSNALKTVCRSWQINWIIKIFSLTFRIIHPNLKNIAFYSTVYLL